MKWKLALSGLMVCSGALAQSGVTADDMLKAVDQMTPAQAQTFMSKLEAKQWEPVPESFFRRMALDVGISVAQLQKVNLSTVTMSGGQRDPKSVSGLDVGILWRAYSPSLRLGLRLDNWTATDANLDAGGYSRADLAGADVLLVANYQFVRNDTWLLWAEVGGGGGGIALDTIDTPAGQPTTLRAFDQSYGEAQLQAGLSYRLNPVIALFAGGGYRFAGSVKLQEGGQDSAVKVDASGPDGRFGIAVNY